MADEHPFTMHTAAAVALRTRKTAPFASSRRALVRCCWGTACRRELLGDEVWGNHEGGQGVKGHGYSPTNKEEPSNEDWLVVTGHVDEFYGLW